jgi:hypothetical protein
MPLSSTASPDLQQLKTKEYSNRKTDCKTEMKKTGRTKNEKQEG